MEAAAVSYPGFEADLAALRLAACGRSATVGAPSWSSRPLAARRERAPPTSSAEVRRPGPAYAARRRAVEPGDRAVRSSVAGRPDAAR